jgi:hypothetical protein
MTAIFVEQKHVIQEMKALARINYVIRNVRVDILELALYVGKIVQMGGRMMEGFVEKQDLVHQGKNRMEPCVIHNVIVDIVEMAQYVGKIVIVGGRMMVDIVEEQDIVHQVKIIMEHCVIHNVIVDIQEMDQYVGKIVQMDG